MNRSKLSLLLAPLVLLSGCSFGASIDTLMAPPKLSIEQEEIYNALTLSTGSAISLKYPKSGKYLSAFIVEDIDGGGDKEAVVFYERNVHSLDENPLRISTFAKDAENSWVPVSDKPAMGSEIEKVMISKLGDNERTNLIIGSSSINRAEKIVSVYTVSGGQLIDPDFSLAYNYFDVVDMDNDGQNYKQYAEYQHHCLRVDYPFEHNVAYACDGLVDVVASHEEPVEVVYLVEIQRGRKQYRRGRREYHAEPVGQVAGVLSVDDDYHHYQQNKHDARDN